MNTLHPTDITRILKALPDTVVAALEANPGDLVLAGGFIRDLIAGDPTVDIDLFWRNGKTASIPVRDAVKGCQHAQVVETPNAWTICMSPRPVQLIFRWEGIPPEEVIDGFDFTVCQAALWFDGKTWASNVSPDFYRDLDARKLTYTEPKDDRSAQSLARMLKFVGRGYVIDWGSLASLLSDALALSYGEVFGRIADGDPDALVVPKGSGD